MYFPSMIEIGSERKWLESLRPGMVRELFEFLPNLLYFAKDLDLKLMAGNRAFVERCGCSHEGDLIGRTDSDLFPIEMAEKFAQDDRRVLETGEALAGIVELFPNRLGEPEWFVTDKIPLFDRDGKVAGLCGMVRGYESAREEIQPYVDLVPVTDYLKKNFAEKVSVPDLAKRAGMSVRQLERRFGEIFKTTPQQYLLKLRVLEACGLLAGTNLAITEIALRVGFYDQSSFSRKFSSLMRVTPRDYRKRFVRTRKAGAFAVKAKCPPRFSEAGIRD
jgi:AraC-like DNA-binding protein